MNSDRFSYTSASEFPAKVLLHRDSLSESFYPLHVQWNITNKCQLKCPYCSCRDRNAGQDMELDMFMEYLRRFRLLGTKAVTITGGGEPLLHPYFDRIVNKLLMAEMEIGLVTNGIAIKKWPKELFQAMKWIRISFDKHRKEIPELYEDVRYAFSYVYQKGSEEDDHLRALIEATREDKVTHLRIVSDIHDETDFFLDGMLDTAPDNVFVQDRRRYTKGQRDCWISLLKPAVDVDGLIYPCCGTQYALKESFRGFPTLMCLGNIQVYEMQHLKKQVPFNGLVCRKCYYDQYNHTLTAIKNLRAITHRNFV